MTAFRVLLSPPEVSDVERSIRFWTEVMGFHETDRNAHGMVFFRCARDNHGIGLKPMKKDKTPARDMKGSLQVEHLAFEVEDLGAFAAELARKGYPLSDGPTPTSSGSLIAFIDAPEGYEVELIQRARAR